MKQGNMIQNNIVRGDAATTQFSEKCFIMMINDLDTGNVRYTLIR